MANPKRRKRRLKRKIRKVERKQEQLLDQQRSVRRANRRIENKNQRLDSRVDDVRRDADRFSSVVDDLREKRTRIRNKRRRERKVFKEDLKQKKAEVDLQGRKRSLFSLGGPGRLRGGSSSSRAISRSSLDTGTGRDNLTGGGRGRSLFNLG